MLYRIRDWDVHFETATTRKLEHPIWLSVPNKQHGMGLKRILLEADGTAIFGTWILIIEACSQQRRPRLGYLTDTGRPDGMAWGPEDLAIKWNRPVDDMTRALAFLTSPKVDWIEAIVRAGISDKSANDPPSSATDLPPSSRSPVQSGPGGSSHRAKPPPPLVLTDDQIRQRNRTELRTFLARKRFACDDTALEEWIGLLYDAGCTTLQAMLECIHWLKREGQRRGIPNEAGQRARYAPAYEGLLPAWRASQRPPPEERTA